eukprot:NODE_7564_length_1567_cov_20.315278.p2 GENE.NODE_7564_length_1567_cov_20.315278~~NODE_7564_length_1567_cov_20.315278.p2  ORF type:complete len:164 (+),score=39.21 NODE_7564_length_1567_cov_20.315278:670-1161(+)
MYHATTMPHAITAKHNAQKKINGKSAAEAPKEKTSDRMSAAEATKEKTSDTTHCTTGVAVLQRNRHPQQHLILSQPPLFWMIAEQSGQCFQKPLRAALRKACALRGDSGGNGIVRGAPPAGGSTPSTCNSDGPSVRLHIAHHGMVPACATALACLAMQQWQKM